MLGKYVLMWPSLRRFKNYSYTITIHSMVHLFSKKVISFSIIAAASKEKLGSHFFGAVGRVSTFLLGLPEKKINSAFKCVTSSYTLTSMFLGNSSTCLICTSSYSMWIPSTLSVDRVYGALLRYLYMISEGAFEWAKPSEWPSSWAATANRL